MQIASSLMVKRIVRYETVIIDSNYRRLVLHFFKYWNGLFAHFLNGNAVTLSELSKASKNNYQPFDEKIEVKSYQYAVAFGDNNRPHSPGAEAFESEALAYEYLRGQVRIDPNLAEKLHVIPHVEVNSSA